MKPIVFGLAMVLIGVAAAPSSGQQTKASSDQPAHKVFVLSGCLVGNPGASDTFKLTGAVPTGQAPPERPAPSTEPKDTYVLLPTTGLTEQGIPRAEMESYVGKKVEATVRPVELAPGPSSSSSAPPSEKLDDPAPPRYTVTKIKALQDSCT